MYLFIYKTTHKNGRFYIGRHQTQLLEDNYLGSGKWVKSIKDKTELTREILEHAETIKQLYELEEYYINLYWNDPLCMNFKKGSIGFTSEDISNMNKNNASIGTHPAQSQKNRNMLSNIQKELAKKGKHNSQTNSFRKEASLRCKNLVEKQLIEGKHITQNDNFRKQSSIRMKKIVSKQMSEGNHYLSNYITVKDENGNVFTVLRNDKNYLSGKYIPLTKDTTPIRDSFGNVFRISKQDPRYLNGEFLPFLKGKKQQKAICPFCGKIGGITNMKRYHFNNCAKK